MTVHGEWWVEVGVSVGISDDEPIVGDVAAAVGRALHEADPSDRRWRVRLRGKSVLFDGDWNAYVDGKRLGLDCLSSVPAPFMGGSWAELAIPGVTTWRCGCGREWVWNRSGWERLVDAEPDDQPPRAEEVKTIGGSFHQHVLRHSHGGGDADHNHVLMAAEACDQSASMTAPRQFWEGMAPLFMLTHDRLAPGDVAEGRFDRAVLAACLAEAVSAVDAAARRLRAAWRNVGGDAGNVEAEG